MILWKVPLVYPLDVNRAELENNNKPKNTPGSAVTKEYTTENVSESCVCP